MTALTKIFVGMEKGVEAIMSNFTELDGRTAVTSGVIDSTSPFVDYSTKKATGAVHYTKVGPIVELSGVVTTSTTLTAGSTGTICTLPANLIPKIGKNAVMSGSYENHWLLSATSDGKLTMDRHGAGAKTLDFASGAWAPFTLTYSVDD
ncbi:hypothetical protein [Lacticaseibacillus hulanensis]|uniref:hypothetical protein n=1 Tax=Lacticaseibacillus hulanensis TaxID=2493111 RepID=UPI000FDAE2D4|nr:hypothetical protein [Lacticaseibacillus hulanensis]